MDNQTLWIIYATILGLLSAASLPIGSAIGLVVKSNRLVIASLAAFGGGALLAALSVELVAPTVSGLVEAGSPEEHSKHASAFYAMIFGALIGGALFVLLDQLVNANGGYLRKYATTISHIAKKRKARYSEMLADMSNVQALQSIPPEAVQSLIDKVRLVLYTPGEFIFKQGEEGNTMVIIKDGEVELLKDGNVLKTMRKGEILGEIALLTGAVRSAGVKAKSTVHVLEIQKQDLDDLRNSIPELDGALRKLASDRLNEINMLDSSRAVNAQEWRQNAISALQQGSMVPTPQEMKQAHAEHAGSPMAIWLGILLDGLPESFIIGTATFAMIAAKLSLTGSVSFFDIVPYTLIAGLFLSNFPEAMSSSLSMRDHGFGKTKILILWGSLMIMTGIGAGFGCYFGESLGHTYVVFIEGLAAGAMLTLIAATMLPEAAHIGGGYISGISTLIGFFAAIAFKLFE